jgi:hypothetical protein
MRIITILCLCVITASASVLLINGDFEQILDTGWEEALNGYYASTGRATYLDPDPDYEAWSTDSFGGYAKISQIADIPCTDLVFSVDAKFYAYDNNEDTLCWAGAAIVLSYLDATSTVLGQTYMCAHTEPCPWDDVSNNHVIVAPDTNWNTYAFNISDELENVPINPSDIKKIEVAVYSVTDHTC